MSDTDRIQGQREISNVNRSALWNFNPDSMNSSKQQISGCMHRSQRFRSCFCAHVVGESNYRFRWEEGPNSFQPTPYIMRTAVDLGLKVKNECCLVSSLRVVHANSEV